MRKDECEEGQRKQKPQALHEDGADAGMIALTVSSGDKDLCADAETESDHENRQIEDSGNGRSSQFHLSDMSQIDRIGQSDELFHHQTEQHGKGDFQDLSV